MKQYQFVYVADGHWAIFVGKLEWTS